MPRGIKNAPPPPPAAFQGPSPLDADDLAAREVSALEVVQLALERPAFIGFLRGRIIELTTLNVSDDDEMNGLIGFYHERLTSLINGDA